MDILVSGNGDENIFQTVLPFQAGRSGQPLLKSAKNSRYYMAQPADVHLSGISREDHEEYLSRNQCLQRRQYLADFLSFFGAQALRGSSSRKGANALRGAIHAIESGRNVVFTPDGPRGPKYKIKNGPVITASKTGCLLVPFVLNSSRCWKLKSWDEFQIPKPFSKLTLIIGNPLSIPHDADEETIEKLRQQAEKALLDITVDPQ